MSRVKDKRGPETQQQQQQKKKEEEEDDEENDSDYHDNDEEETPNGRHHQRHPTGKKQKFQYNYGTYVAPIFMLPGNRVVFDNQSYTGKVLHSYCYKHGIPLTLREGSHGFISVDKDVAIAANVFSAPPRVTNDKAVFHHPPPAATGDGRTFFHSEATMVRPPVKIITTVAKIAL